MKTVIIFLLGFLFCGCWAKEIKGCKFISGDAVIIKGMEKSGVISEVRVCRETCVYRVIVECEKHGLCGRDVWETALVSKKKKEREPG